MMRTHAHHAPGAPAQTTAADLEALLRDLIAHHERMLALCIAHAGALARADGPATARLIEEQQTVGRAIIDLDARRARLVAAWNAAAPAHGMTRAPASGTLSALAARLPEPARGRVLDLASRLRGILNALVDQQRVVARASETLLGHMQGLMAQVARRLSHAGTYARPGAPAALGGVGGGLVVSGLDVRS